MVLSNWHNVLRAVQMASSECIGMRDRGRFSYCGMLTDYSTVKVPKPKADGDALMAEDADPPLPQTLVRIPTEQP